MANIIPLIGSGGIGKSSACIGAALRLHEAGVSALYIPGAVVNFIGILTNLIQRDPSKDWSTILKRISIAPVDDTIVHSIARNIDSCSLGFIEKVKVSILLKLLQKPSDSSISTSTYFGAFKQAMDSQATPFAMYVYDRFSKEIFPTEDGLNPLSYLAPLANDYQQAMRKRTLERDSAGTVVKDESAMIRPGTLEAIKAEHYSPDCSITVETYANKEYSFADYVKDCSDRKFSVGRLEVDRVIRFVMTPVKYILIDSYETMAGVEQILAPGGIDIGPTVKLPEMQTRLSSIFAPDATIIVTSRLPAYYFEALVANAQAGMLLRKDDLIFISSGYRNNPYYFQFDNRDASGSIILELLNYGNTLNKIAPLSMLPYLNALKARAQFTNLQIIDPETWFDWLKAIKEESSTEKDALSSVIQYDRLAHYEITSGSNLNSSMAAFIRNFTPTTTIESSKQ